MKRKASAVWRGDGMTGKGSLTTQSGVFREQPYSFQTRFGSEDGKAGTNPEELIAAAHAGCFSMALAFMLAGGGFKTDSLSTDAEVEIVQIDGHFSITGITLNLVAEIPNITAEKFSELANAAKANCPVSRALASVPIHFSATLA
jgi:lipoyl-dependent peroxiredoxin